MACAPGSGHPPPPAAWSRTLGQRLDLNRLSVEELSAIPGIGRKLGAALAGERATRHGFSDWSEVAAVKGVGRTKLDLLQGLCALEPARDGG